ncbi:hypothetical protein F511_44472 [Dorcoceras hygrometricum]|uniref:Uncharacterized protein n=1 Tax=Dorcoceras hygrometricum TaxID=472368 RepID=A0A2Z6ZXT9_9LAMI|nr:hypothetical protein F511_44472 [Dorcoceras hygrometricum]
MATDINARAMHETAECRNKGLQPNRESTELKNQLNSCQQIEQRTVATMCGQNAYYPCVWAPSSLRRRSQKEDGLLPIQFLEVKVYCNIIPRLLESPLQFVGHGSHYIASRFKIIVPPFFLFGQLLMTGIGRGLHRMSLL